MKQLILILTAACTIAIAAQPAKAITFQRDPLNLISFRAQDNAKIIIRNSAGKIVRSKNCYGNICNIESSSLQPGNYSYTIMNGGSTCEGTFSVK